MMKRILTIFCSLLLCSLTLPAQQTIKVQGITFQLAEEFELYSRQDRIYEEALMIAPKANPDNDRLVLQVQPDATAGIEGLTSEEVSEMLTAAVNKLTDIIVNPKRNSGYTLDQTYRVHFDDDINVPNAYTNVSGKNTKGERFLMYAEATLVNGFIVSCCAISPGKGPLDDMVAVYHELIAGAAEAPVNHPKTNNVTAGGFFFELDEALMIIDKSRMEDGETVQIAPKSNPNGTDQLFLLIYPDILPNYKELSSTKLSEITTSSTRKLADVIAREYDTEAFEIIDDPNDLFPSASTDFKGKDDKGKAFKCHTETTLINGSMIVCCAVGTSDEMMEQLLHAYSSANSALLFNRRLILP